VSLRQLRNDMNDRDPFATDLPRLLIKPLRYRLGA
jgi:hypothetical protein